MPFTLDALKEARDQGYKDNEIYSHLAKVDPRFNEAQKQGYSLDEVAQHFSAPPPLTMVEKEQKFGSIGPEETPSTIGGKLTHAIGAIRNVFEPPIEGGAGNIAQLAITPPAKMLLNSGQPAAEASGAVISKLSEKGLPEIPAAALGTVGAIAGDPLNYIPGSKGIKNIFDPRAILETSKQLAPTAGKLIEPIAGVASKAKNTIFGAKAIPAGQELPALNQVLKEGIGPELKATATAEDSKLLSVLDNVKGSRRQLGNNIGQVVAQADTALGPINPKKLQPIVGNAVSNALANSPVVTPQAKAAVDKWFEHELPEITSLNKLQEAKTNFTKAIQGHLGVEGDLSSVPLSSIKNALGDVLESQMPGHLKDSFQAANKAFSQFATIEDGVKAATPGLKTMLKGKTPTIGKQELALDPARFSKWWNEAVDESTKAKFDPAFRIALDQLTTQPNPSLMKKGLSLLIDKGLNRMIPKGIGEIPLFNEMARVRPAFSPTAQTAKVASKAIAPSLTAQQKASFLGFLANKPNFQQTVAEEYKRRSERR